ILRSEHPGRSEHDPLQAALLEIVLGLPLVAEPVLLGVLSGPHTADVHESPDARGLGGIDLVTCALEVDFLEGNPFPPILNRRARKLYSVDDALHPAHARGQRGRFADITGSPFDVCPETA